MGNRVTAERRSTAGGTQRQLASGGLVSGPDSVQQRESQTLTESLSPFIFVGGPRRSYVPSIPVRPLTEVPYYPYLRYRVVVEDEYGSLLVVTRDGLRRQRDALRIACETEADPHSLIALATWQQRKARISPVELEQVCHHQRYDELEAHGALPADTDAVQTCSVCFEDFEPSSMVRRLPRCGHIFHDDCIRGWACHKKAQCPVCRAWILDDTDMRQRSMAEAAIRAELQHAALVEERIREVRLPD
ncbi:hypothetical protein F1559_002244 [Cyanidiococcus yangmingshanensis]|uniref:RING-type domain-containing protein n=1 Tax=Cyanidiococcus yangmingshanensis TaxID=2690220 RepID=A0A7J7IBJ8_9RHOD|nr:hypothetical protein F1559_002244 [Cyanidiococcus yangmingshanensis]